MCFIPHTIGFHVWHFFSILDISSNPIVPSLVKIFGSPPFPHKRSGGHANHFQGSLYFSFLPVKQRDFPGNVRSGGCDSLPLVVAFTSKQRDSLLSYALHFLHIISHQMCCAGERAEILSALQTVEKSLHLPEKNARKAHELPQRRVSDGQGQPAESALSWKRNTNRRKTKRPDELTLHLSLGHEHMSLWYAVYFRRTPGPTVTCWSWSPALNLTRCLTWKTQAFGIS